MTTLKKVVVPTDLGSGHAIDLITQKVTVPSADVWRKQSDNTQAGADSDAIQHTGNAAFKQNLAARTKSLATSSQLDATDSSNIRLTSAGVIHGINGGEDGKLLVLTNVSAGEITLTHNSATATAGTKIKIGDNLTFTMPPNASVSLNYDPVDLCWRTVSQTVLGFAPQYMQCTATAAQTGIVFNRNINLTSVSAVSGTDISLSAPGILLKAGRTYRLRGYVPLSSNGFLTYRWHNGTAFVGGISHNEHATSRSPTGGGGAAVAIVAPTVDTIYYLRCVSAGGSISTHATILPHADVEVIRGLSPASAALPTKDTFSANNTTGSWNGLTGKTILTFTSKAGAKYLINYSASIFSNTASAGHYIRLDSNGTQIGSANHYFNQALVHHRLTSSVIFTPPNAATQSISLKTSAPSDSNDYCSITIVEL